MEAGVAERAAPLTSKDLGGGDGWESVAQAVCAPPANAAAAAKRASSTHGTGLTAVDEVPAMVEGAERQTEEEVTCGKRDQEGFGVSSGKKKEGRIGRSGERERRRKGAAPAARPLYASSSSSSSGSSSPSGSSPSSS